AIAARKTLALLDLRPYFALLAWGVVCLPAAPVAVSALRAVPPRLRAFAHPAVVVGPLVLALVLGAGDAVRNGATNHTGLGVPFIAFVQHIFDLDRDGYSSVLGGGDCKDLDARIHTGAVAIHGNGLDDESMGSSLHAMPH